MRKFAAVLVGYVMLNVVLATLAGAADFGDVPPDYWAREEIRYVTDRGLFLGKSAETFDPVSGMTRGQMAMVLYRLAGLPDTEAAMTYMDVPEGTYYYDAVRWARENGIFTAEKLASDTLTPDETVTRGEFAVMLRNFDRARGCAAPAVEEAEGPFTDMDTASGEVRNAILGWAYPMGVLRGTTETTMNPSGRLTRAHVAAMLARYDRGVGNTGAFAFQVVKPHTLAEIYTGQLEPDTTYTLLVGEAYGDGNYAVTSSNPDVAEIAYTYYAWQIRTGARGTATLTATDKRTGAQRILRVTVGKSADTPSIPADGASSLNAFREKRLEMIRLANETRIRSGVKEVTVSEALMDAAQEFAETMPRDHDLTREYELRAKNGCYHGVGCNLHYTGVELSELAESAVRAWERSRAHYIAMVNESADSMGIGVYYDEAGRTYYCVMFVGDCLAESALFGNAHQ